MTTSLSRRGSVTTPVETGELVSAYADRRSSAGTGKAAVGLPTRVMLNIGSCDILVLSFEAPALSGDQRVEEIIGIAESLR